jgi:coenzyme F420 hydrogenase subunit beta
MMSITGPSDVCEQLIRRVIRPGLCTGCGACVGLDASGKSVMEDTPLGPVPKFALQTRLNPLAFESCPGKGLDYPQLYTRCYGALPKNWLTGPTLAVRIGHAADETVRRNGASGGVLSQVLISLLEERLVDAAIVVRQGLPTPEQACAVFATTRQDILDAAQSVYIPVATLDKLRELEPGKRYAMTCLPDQAAALRYLQLAGDPRARQIRYVLGPYTGTALYPAAIRSFLRSSGVSAKDGITSLKWRAGEWPGYLEIRTQSGRVIRSNKFYYNYLIPFFITRNSLQNMDFANEFCDLSVGDAWSPKYEHAGGGHSVITTRTQEMEDLVARLAATGRLTVNPVDEFKATEMHGHMIDFKKRGGYIRNRMRRFWGRPAADFGMKPAPLSAIRVLVELVISGIFLLAGTPLCRWMIERIPERFIGPVFNRLRLTWKAASKPAKRKKLGSLKMISTSATP